MAIKIIKKEPHPSVIKEVVCRVCGCTLQYAPVDIKRRDGIDYSGGPDGCTYIVCPSCSDKVILESW